MAAGLAAAGLRKGDRLGVFMANSLACLHTWFAANQLGAVWAPINIHFRGLPLRHVFELASADLFICDEDLMDVLHDVISEDTDTRFILNGDPSRVEAPCDALEDFYSGVAADTEVIHFSDPAALLFTSGTTGRSKACVLSHSYFLHQANILIREFGLRADDVLYCPFPLFHADATALTTVPALLLGCPAAIGRRFSASRFWDEVRDTGATVFDFMGATLSILWKAEPLPSDSDNPVRLAWGVPVPEWAPQFEHRFDLEIVELYGSVEASIPVTQRRDQPRVAGSCGQCVPEFEITIADDQDIPVGAGVTGEILVRPRAPSIIFDEYFAMPEATMSAFRNLWFHTGDLGKLDSTGNLYFVGRKKDVIRRRGENISAFEVEESVLLHPDVMEAAAVGVPSELGEEDVMLYVVARPGADLNPREIIDHCELNLARFQIPKYIDFIDELPKTPTGKVEKHRLTDLGLRKSTWDSEKVEG